MLASLSDVDNCDNNEVIFEVFFHLVCSDC